MASVSLASANQSPSAAQADLTPPRKSLLKVVAEPLACLAILGAFLYAEPVNGIYYLAGAAATACVFTLRDKLKSCVESGDIEILKAKHEEIGKKIDELETKDSDLTIAALEAEHESAQEVLRSAVENAVKATQALTKMRAPKVSESAPQQRPLNIAQSLSQPLLAQGFQRDLHQDRHFASAPRLEQFGAYLFPDEDAAVPALSHRNFAEVPRFSGFASSAARGPDVRTSSLRQIDRRTPEERRRIDEILATLAVRH